MIFCGIKIKIFLNKSLLLSFFFFLEFLNYFYITLFQSFDLAAFNNIFAILFFFFVLLFLRYNNWAYPYFFFVKFYEGGFLNTNLLNGLNNIHPLIFFCLFVCLIQFNFIDIKNIVNIRFSLLKKNKKLFFLLNVLCLFLLFLGSFWASQELLWGSWWSWDPIETYLLVVFYFVIIQYHKNEFFIMYMYNLKFIFFVFLFFFISNKLSIFTFIHIFDIVLSTDIFIYINLFIILILLLKNNIIIIILIIILINNYNIIIIFNIIYIIYLLLKINLNINNIFIIINNNMYIYINYIYLFIITNLKKNFFFKISHLIIFIIIILLDKQMDEVSFYNLDYNLNYKISNNNIVLNNDYYIIIEYIYIYFFYNYISISTNIYKIYCYNSYYSITIFMYFYIFLGLALLFFHFYKNEKIRKLATI